VPKACVGRRVGGMTYPDSFFGFEPSDPGQREQLVEQIDRST